MSSLKITVEFCFPALGASGQLFQWTVFRKGVTMKSIMIVCAMMVATLVGCAKTDAKAKAEKEAESFNSNVDSWMNHPAVEEPAQLKLAPKYEAVVRRLIDENFTSHDPAVLRRVGRKIYDIGGEMAIPIVLEYVDDPRVAVAENAKLWYKHYSPKAILDKIEKAETAAGEAKKVAGEVARKLLEAGSKKTEVQPSAPKARATSRPSTEAKKTELEAARREKASLQQRLEALREKLVMEKQIANYPAPQFQWEEVQKNLQPKVEAIEARMAECSKAISSLSEKIGRDSLKSSKRPSRSPCKRPSH